MPSSDRTSLRKCAIDAGNLSQRFLCSSGRIAGLKEAVEGSSLGGRREELRGRSVLVNTHDQLSTALALLELDGIARRLVLWPADLPAEHLPFVMRSAEVDATVTTDPAGDFSLNISLTSTNQKPPANEVTEWILLTSGTTGRPKMVVHTLSTLCGAIESGSPSSAPIIWSTFYDIRRYGGLQILLRAMLSGGSIVLSDAHQPTADFLSRAGASRVTHISGTPSHWRRALMSSCAGRISPQYIRISGEIADQAILDKLGSFYRHAQVTHAFASTEAGVAFDVGDGREGFPSSILGQPDARVEMKIVAGSLHIRSSRNAIRYLGEQALVDGNGFIDTGDLVQLRNGRYYFAGRRDGVINVGGQKVHPEEVESVINRHPHVRMSRVRAKSNPVLGALVVADVVLQNLGCSADQQSDQIASDILRLCRSELSRHKVPVAIHFIGDLALGSSGKIARQHV